MSATSIAIGLRDRVKELENALREEIAQLEQWERAAGRTQEGKVSAVPTAFAERAKALRRVLNW